MRYRLFWLAVFAAFFVFGQAAATEQDLSGQGWTSKEKVHCYEYEIKDGYFNIGKEGTIMARPGTELHQWLVSAKGHRLKISRAEEVGPLSHLYR